MNIYKRDKKGIICEIIVPVILVIFGLSVSKFTFLKTSPTMPLVPTVFPLKQRLLLNEDLITTTNPGTITPLQLYNNLPDVDSAFELT